MRNLKSLFMFSKQQRKGISLLIILIIIFQCIYFFVDFSSEEIVVNKQELAKFNKEIDSLKLIKIEKRKSKTYAFNPNFITDYKGSLLGMSNKEIDRLLNFRNQNQWINSTKQFQEVTKVSDSLLNKIAPYFKFPEWVTKSKNTQVLNKKHISKSKVLKQKQDLNKATAEALQNVVGIGSVLSKRIIKYRNKTPDGFVNMVQLQDVYGLSPEVIERLSEIFYIVPNSKIKKINLNTATVNQLVNIKYIDYEIAYNIIEQRQLRAGYKSLDELMKVKDFPVNKIDIIKLYLLLE